MAPMMVGQQLGVDALQTDTCYPSVPHTSSPSLLLTQLAVRKCHQLIARLAFSSPGAHSGPVAATVTTVTTPSWSPVRSKELGLKWILEQGLGCQAGLHMNAARM